MASSVVVICSLLVILFVLNSNSNRIIKRQASGCIINGRDCSGQPCRFEAPNNVVLCTCGAYNLPQCSTQPKTPPRQRCYDRNSRRYHNVRETWTRRVNGRTLDCTCERNRISRRMQISCTGENRCHYKTTSYVRGDDWRSSDVTGVILNCQCHGNERVTCRGSVTRDTPQPETNVQLVGEHIVHGSEVFRPRITTLQACDTGDRVVSSGYSWNKTTSVRPRHFTVERCQCRDALIQCEPHHVSRSAEPHCLTEDGQVKRVGEKWKKVHHTHANVRWDCICRSHGQKSCKDIGYCKDPTPPPNGGMVCVTKGKAGPTQTIYCKPMCQEGSDFLSRQRYFRIWEVCNEDTHHRWSGGYASDALLLAKCRRAQSLVRGRPSLYLPTTDCRSLSVNQINTMKLDFIRSLQRSNLCGTGNNCVTKWFKCG